ncbi:MAG TPA: phage tail sheath subtilisin-like domain-containing protein [Chthoniobacterales bacterium]
MPIQPTYPGVYVQEVPSGVRTITGVSTSIAAFIGMINRGRVDTPVRVLSFTEYERNYGNDRSVSEMTDQVRQFFFNGGQQAYILRIADGALAARATIENEFGLQVLSLTAKEEGVIGQSLRVEVDYDTVSPEASFNLRVFRQFADANGNLVEEAQEAYSGLSMNPASGRFAVDVLTQQSALVNAALPAALNVANETFSGYTLSGRLFGNAVDAPVDDLRASINAAIAATAGGAAGQFRVSVDSMPFVNVTLAAIPGPTDPRVALEQAIDNRLSALGLGLGVAVDMPVGPANGGNPASYLRIRTDATDGSVVFSPGAADDIASVLELTVERGAVAVDGYAALRPMASGLVFRPGPLDPTDPVWFDAFTALASRVPGDITNYQLDDSIDSHTPTNPIALTPATVVGGLLVDGPTVSLNNFAARLGQIEDAINVEAGLDPDFQWSAALHGYRLVLTPTFGDANARATALLTDDGGGGGYNLGAANNGLDIGANRNNTRYYSLDNNALGEYQTTAGNNGSDGTTPLPPNYDAAYAILDSAVDLFNIMILPRAATQNDNAMQNLWGAASIFCQQRRAFLLVDPPRDAGTGWNSIADVSSGIAAFRIGITTDHAAVYWPQVLVADAATTRAIAPSGSIAGLMARTDSNRGVWKAPAGTEATIRNVRGVQRVMSDPENGIINPLAVNAIRVFPNGVVSWGARTMVGFDNSGNDDYKYVPVRRLALFLEESLYRGLRFAVFEPNDEPLWAQIRLAAGAFMNGLFRRGAFQGQKASDAYFVKVDSETTTQNDINLGIVNVVVGFAPLKPAEFVIITLQQLAGQVQV